MGWERVCHSENDEPSVMLSNACELPAAVAHRRRGRPLEPIAPAHEPPSGPSAPVLAWQASSELSLLEVVCEVQVCWKRKRATPAYRRVRRARLRIPQFVLLPAVAYRMGPTPRVAFLGPLGTYSHQVSIYSPPPCTAGAHSHSSQVTSDVFGHVELVPVPQIIGAPDHPNRGADGAD